MSKNAKSEVVQPTRSAAIRQKCLECSGGSHKEVKDCVIPECPLYIYRMGRVNRARRNPNRKGKGNVKNLKG